MQREIHDDKHGHQGLQQDLALMQRRRALGCGGGSDDTMASNGSGSWNSGGSTGGSSGSTGSCPVIPEETAGPYPGDGSNSNGGGIANALALTGIVRSDIRASIAGASGTAGGVVLTITIRLVNTNGSCANLAGYAIYLWHCDREGRYSMYSSGVTGQNYLRGVRDSLQIFLQRFGMSVTTAADAGHARRRARATPR